MIPSPRFISCSVSSLCLAALLMVSGTAPSHAAPGFQLSQGTGLETEEPAFAPKPQKPTSAKPTDAKGPTVITCTKQTTFDEKTRTAVFSGDVKVTGPQFDLTADKLTAFLKKDKEPGAPTPTPEPAKKTGTASADTKSADTASGLEKAVAEGNVIITQEKVDAEGKVTRYMGKGDKATYDSTSGDMVLTGWPQIQQGMNNQVSTEEGTIMILNRDGRLRTVGGSKTIIQSEVDGDKKRKKTTPAEGSLPEAKSPL